MVHFIHILPSPCFEQLDLQHEGERIKRLVLGNRDKIVSQCGEVLECNSTQSKREISHEKGKTYIDHP